MAACHSQSPDHSLLLGRLPQATTSWSMPHGRMPLATTSQSMPHGRMPLAIASQSMPHGRLPLPVSKNRDEHAIMPLGCLPLSYFPYNGVGTGVGKKRLGEKRQKCFERPFLSANL